MALKQNQAFALCQSLWPFARVRVIVITTKLMSGLGQGGKGLARVAQSAIARCCEIT